MSSTLHIAVADEKGRVPVTVFHLSGDLDANTQPDLEQKAEKLISGGARNILIDLGQVGYMGSAGLRAIHSISNMLKSSGGGNLKLLNPSDAVQRVFFTLGFDRYFDIKHDLNEAIQSF